MNTPPPADPPPGHSPTGPDPQPKTGDPLLDQADRHPNDPALNGAGPIAAPDLGTLATITDPGTAPDMPTLTSSTSSDTLTLDQPPPLADPTADQYLADLRRGPTIGPITEPPPGTQTIGPISDPTMRPGLGGEPAGSFAELGYVIGAGLNALPSQSPQQLGLDGTPGGVARAVLRANVGPVLQVPAAIDAAVQSGSFTSQQAIDAYQTTGLAIAGLAPYALEVGAALRGTGITGDAVASGSTTLAEVPRVPPGADLPPAGADLPPAVAAKAGGTASLADDAPTSLLDDAAPAVGAVDGPAVVSRRLAESPDVPPGAVTQPGGLDDYPSGSGFSGVYDPESGAVLAYPSDTTRLASGAEPPTLLPRNGGHGDVNDFLANATGRDVDGSTFGFTMFLRENGTIEVEWFSRMANCRFSGCFVPEAQRAKILDAITAATGRAARTKR